MILEASEPADGKDDIAGLVRQLQDLERKLQGLGGGGRDAIGPPAENVRVLRQAQEYLLRREGSQRWLGATQAAVLDALPAHVALLDERGTIVALNASWVSDLGFAGLRSAQLSVGHNYLVVCEAVVGEGAEDAHSAAAGARAVLNGDKTAFALEYRCASAGGERWFRMTVTPVLGDAQSVESGGAVLMHIDVTERKRNEHDLVQSNAMLDVAGRLAKVGGWSVDLPASRVAWTDVIAAVHEEPAGFSPQIEAAFDYFPPEHRSVVQAAFERCASDGIPYDLELEIITARGRRVWVRGIGEAVRDASGAILRVQGALQDISARKQAEFETRRLGVKLTSIVESLTDAFYTVDREWRFTYVNAAAERMVHRHRDELKGRVLWEVFPRLRDTPFHSEYERAVRENQAISIEAFYPPGDAWFLAKAYPSEGGLAIFVRDTTLERAARRQLRLLEASVSQLNDIVLITEAAPLKAPGPRIVFVNNAFERCTGYSRSEVLGHSPRILQGPKTDRAELNRITVALARFEPVHAELLNYRKNGEAYWIELEIVPVVGLGADNQDTYTHFVAVERDITERKRDEDALQALNAELESRVLERTNELSLAREEAEQASRAKSVFLAAMSHEIRTPMNGVIGMIDVLHQTSLRGHQVEMVDLIRDSAFSLLKIIEDILDFSKIEAGKLHIEAEPLQLADAVEKVCGMLDHMATDRGVRLTVFIDPAIPPTVLGDEIRLRQVLVNLAGNAIKFSGGRDEKPGQVAVRALLVERQQNSATVDLIVADNGIGMDAETLQRLFTPFTQADASTTRRFGGTGLGLAISRMLVQLMGGEIRVQSSPSQGSTFTARFLLPLASSGDEEHVQSPLGGLHCRIVGDEQPLAADLGAYLKHAGATVHYSADLASAVEERDARKASSSEPGVWVMLPGFPPPAAAALALGAGERVQGDADTSFVLLGRGKRRRPRFDAGVVSVDVDTLFRHALVKAVAVASGRVPREALDEPAQTEAMPIRPLPRHEAKRQNRLILIAEDNETNRKVILRQMALVGYAAEVAVNGREALESWRTGDFALLLTDLHMPEMDGYALATAIRAEEKPGHRTPIIALTANAMRDEELRCRAAGMDGYMTKPVRLPQLKSAIDNWLASPGKVGAVPAAQTAVATVLPPADLSVLEAMVGDDPRVIADVLLGFRKSAEELRTAMRKAALAGALPVLGSSAHQLKASAWAVGAQQLGSICAEIEGVARAGRTELIGALLESFEFELNATLRFLNAALVEVAK